MINRFLFVICAGLLFAVDAQHIVAQVVPFRVDGSGTAPMGASVFGFDSPHNATGNGTYLGKYTGNEGVFNSLSFDPMTGSGTFKGRFVFVAANGNRLACSYGDTGNGAAEDGFYFAIPSAVPGKFVIVFVAEFNPILAECTGRFAALTGGGFTMLAMTEPIDLVLDQNGFTPPFALSWVGEGTLTFDQGN
jgi:hypothetical protein